MEKLQKAQIWDSLTYFYDKENKISYRRLSAIANEINKRKSGNIVLELGCGLAILKKILGQEYRYYGCDISLKVVGMHNDENIVSCDLDFELPFVKQKFDFVVCSGTIEYLKEPTKFLLGIKNYADQNTIFLFTITNSANLVRRLSAIRGHFPFFPTPFRNYFSVKEFEKLLRRCEFAVEKFFAASYISEKSNRLLVFIFRAFPSLFGDQIVFVCTVCSLKPGFSCREIE